MKKCGGGSHDSCNRLSRSDGGVTGDRSVSGLSSLFASGRPATGFDIDDATTRHGHSTGISKSICLNPHGLLFLDIKQNISPYAIFSYCGRMTTPGRHCTSTCCFEHWLISRLLFCQRR